MGTPPAQAERSFSKASTAGPVVSQSLVSASTTAWTSLASMDCRPYGSTRSPREGWNRRSGEALGQVAQLLDAEPEVVVVRPVGPAVLDGLAVGRRLVPPPGHVRHDHVAVAEAEGPARVVAGDHLLVQLLAGPDPDLVGRRARRHRFGEVGDLHAGDAGHVQLTAVHHVERVDHELHGLR